MVNTASLAPWAFIWAAFALVVAGTAALIALSWWGMRRAERQRDSGR